jgi:hypothetical protein
MGSRYLTDLADVLRGAGLVVVEVGGPSTVGSGWKNRARSSGGYDSGKPTCIMVHHTASSTSASGWDDANYCTFHSDNEPVCNLLVGRDAKWYVCAAGATNTNGSGRGCSRCPPDSMNTHAIGVEASNNGVGEGWSVAMQDAYVRGVAALSKHYGIPNDHIHSHESYAPDRKVDPAGPARFVGNANQRWEPAGGMTKFRQEVAAIVSGGGGVEDDEPVAYVLIQEFNGATAVSNVWWCSDMKNKWAVSLTGDMWDTLIWEFKNRGWDTTIRHVSPSDFPAYGDVKGPVPAAPAGKKFDVWGRLLAA